MSVTNDSVVPFHTHDTTLWLRVERLWILSLSILHTVHVSEPYNTIDSRAVPDLFFFQSGLDWSRIWNDILSGRSRIFKLTVILLI